MCWTGTNRWSSGNVSGIWTTRGSPDDKQGTTRQWQQQVERNHRAIYQWTDSGEPSPTAKTSNSSCSRTRSLSISPFLIFHSFTHPLSHTLPFFCLWVMILFIQHTSERGRAISVELNGRRGMRRAFWDHNMVSIHPPQLWGFFYILIRHYQQPNFRLDFCVWNRDLNTSSPLPPHSLSLPSAYNHVLKSPYLCFSFPPGLLSLLFLWGKGRREEGEEGRGVLLLNVFLIFSAYTLPLCFFHLKERIAWAGKFFLLFLKHFRVLTKEFFSYSLLANTCSWEGLSLGLISPFLFTSIFLDANTLCWRRCNKASIPQNQEHDIKQFICKRSFISLWYSFLSSHNAVVISYVDHMIRQKVFRRGHIQVVQGKTVIGEWGSYTGTTFEEAPRYFEISLFR